MYITYLFSLNKLFQCDDTKIFVHFKEEECIHFIKDQQFGCTIKFQRSITSIWAHLQVGLNLHYNNKGLFCDPNIIANNKERCFRNPAVVNHNSSQTLKLLRYHNIHTRTITKLFRLQLLLCIVYD
jgi:hypothetical protein